MEGQTTLSKQASKQASKQTYKSVIFACKQTEYDNKLGLLLFGI